ncbi:MAG: DNA polymerase III subunit beta [Verrucomicrobia bacterium]|nr:DNA polymerase III subunit beta [Verrucomicrobiota bacterium]
MKINVTKDQVLEALQQVQNVVSTRTTLPILSNVLLRASGETLELTTTDLDVGIQRRVSAKVVKPGATSLPARRLFSIVRELPDGEIEIEVDEKNIASISCGSSFFKIVGLPAEEFPPLPKLEGGKSYKLTQTSLRDLIRKTAYAISNDETRYVLNGIYMGFKAEKLTMVATDGRRLALVEQDLEFPKASEAEAILPSKAVTELNHLLGDKGEVQITLTENQMAFVLHVAAQATGAETQGKKEEKETTKRGSEAPNVLLVSKLIEGTYPNYRQVIPSESKERVTLDREGLLTALRRAALLCTDKSNSVRMQFGKNNLSIIAKSPDVGEAKESMAINYKGKEIAVAFNPEYLMDPLRNLENDEIYMELTDELSPGVIKINAPFLYVLMPMRMT